jgi:intracellular sulfur oxidation DsrE/DsrF family protein
MLIPPAAAVLPFRFNSQGRALLPCPPLLVLTMPIRQWFVLLIVCLAPVTLQGQQFIPAGELPSRYLARIEVHNSDELSLLLRRAEQLFDGGQLTPGKDSPIAFVLHGQEANLLLMANYQANKSLVDLAARLSAFKVVDIKVCSNWMGAEDLDVTQLPPFVDTVPLGPAEEQRLLGEHGYVYF